MYKNSVKLLTNNFSVVWKTFLYLFICFFACAVLGYLCLTPFINILYHSGWMSELSGLFETIYSSPKDFITVFNETSTHAGMLFLTSFNRLWGYYLVLTLIITLFSILWNIGYFTVGDVLNGTLTSGTGFGFTNRLVVSLRKSIPFALLKLVIGIPFFLVIVLFGFIYLTLATSLLSSILLLPLLILLCIATIALKHTILAGFMPALVNENMKTIKAFSKGYKAVNRRFAKTYSTAVILLLTVILINFLLGIFTLGAGLIVTIPASLVLFAIFNLVMYYGSENMRYYLSENIIMEKS